MGTPRRPRPRQLARTNAMRNSSYSADAPAGGDGEDDFLAYAAAGAGGGGGYASQTSFRISGGSGGAEEVAELFRMLGLSGPEDFAIPPAVYAAAMSHLPNAARRRASLDDSPRAGPEASSSSSAPSETPESSARDVAVAARPSAEGEEAVLATELVQSEITQVTARTYQAPGAESQTRLVQQEVLETTSTSKVTAASKPGNAAEEKGNDKPPKAATLRKERRRELVAVETTREATGGGALAVVVAESTSADVEHWVSPSPHRRFRRTITSWIKGGHIGSGSFGSVYEAISDDGFFFAVKEVSLIDQGINAKQRIVQLEHEVSLLSRLEHDNIVQYYGTDKEDGKFYIFLELVTQGSLAALYQKYCLQDSQVSAYTRQILNGLNYLHQRNVLHRDIKCANLLVDANGLVKLADFGLAKEMSILSQARSSKGTVYWMAPEVAKAKPHGPPADIWSLGCTVLEMLTGKVPYPDMEWTHALLKIGRGIPPKIPNTLSEDARDFIVRCVQSNPKDRPSAAELLDHPFVKRPLQH
ncbi:mitogen-activated protein kinase kinase kinase 1-like [Lolium rigidum]|uniref:mitogen-activated protein kinase kinase kinase 1-like n=1 Tax=Lolium rigidum TaxID=89674 RepID=UPI001F5D06DC|nr:mitogen-activated protein kinase kinase kinase 1-like [Lolium rigidum]